MKSSSYGTLSDRGLRACALPERLVRCALRSGRPLRALRADFLDPAQRVAELGQPGVRVLAGQPDAPGESIGPGAGDARVYQGVEYPPLRLAESGHNRARQRGEHLGHVAAARPPGDLPAELALGLPRDLDPPRPGLLAEPLDAPFGGRVRVVGLGLR